MSDIVRALEKLASNAAITLEHSDLHKLTNLELTAEQQLAIANGDIEALEQLITDLPEIKCFGIIPAEDDEPSEGEDKSNDEATESSLQSIAL